MTRPAPRSPPLRRALRSRATSFRRTGSTRLFVNIYKDMPLPNQTLSTDTTGGLSGNYGVGGVLKLNRNQYDFKSNYNINQKLTTWGKYSRMDAPVEGKYPFGDLGGAALGTAGFGDTTTQLVTGGFNYTISPTFLFDGVFGYTRMDQFVGIPNIDKNIGLDVWKIPGTNGGVKYANDDRYGGAPAVTGFGFSDIGALDTWTPVWRHERAYTYQSNFSKVFSAHEVRFGFDVRRLELNHWQPETANPRGSVNFGSGVTNVQGQVAPHAECLRRRAPRSGQQLLEVRAVLRNEDARIAVRVLRPRPVAGAPQRDAEPRPPLRVLSAAQPR